MVWRVRLEEPETWKWNGRKASEYRIRTNDLRVAELRPHIVAVDRGQLFTTNQWGMATRNTARQSLQVRFESRCSALRTPSVRASIWKIRFQSSWNNPEVRQYRSHQLAMLRF